MTHDLIAVISARLITILNVNTGNCDEKDSNHTKTNIMRITVFQNDIDHVSGRLIEGILDEETETDEMDHVITENGSEGAHQR